MNLKIKCKNKNKEMTMYNLIIERLKDLQKYIYIYILSMIYDNKCVTNFLFTISEYLIKLPIEC